jgi:hypothetical protein
VTQQAREFLADTEVLPQGIVLLDNDGRYVPAFDEMLEAGEVWWKRYPPDHRTSGRM